MSSLFAMRRANGDWFAIDDRGRFRVPVFHSFAEAMIARTRHTDMECFRPVILDEVAFTDLTTTSGGEGCFWLVQNPLLRLSRGRPLDDAQLREVLVS